MPGHVDGNEIAVRAVLGQQVSVAGARTVAGRLIAEHGKPVAGTDRRSRTCSPMPATVAGLDPEDLPMPRLARPGADRAGRRLAGRATSPSTAAPDRDDVRRALLAIPGIGPWTADYIAMRALGHPDVFLPTDLGIRDALAGLGHDPAGRRRWPRTGALALLRADAPVADPDAWPSTTEEN